jgi:hypothetical protein
VSGHLHAPATLPPGKSPGTHWIGDWVGPRTGLDDVENRKFLTLPGLELRPLCRPARRQSLYRLRYPDSRDKYIPDYLSSDVNYTWDRRQNPGETCHNKYTSSHAEHHALPYIIFLRTRLTDNVAHITLHILQYMQMPDRHSGAIFIHVAKFSRISK